MFIKDDVVHEPLYVVTPIFNPVRFASRWEHYKNFARHITDAGAKLVTIEAAFGDRAFALEGHAPDTNGHQYIQVRVGQDSEIWLKESLTNVAVSRLPSDWQYMAMVDADMTFQRPDIISETVHALQHYDALQMYSHILAAGPDHLPLSAIPSFGYQYAHDLLPSAKEGAESSGVAGKSADSKAVKQQPGAPGGAWAWRRSALNAVGGLIEHGILGSGDYYMARALIGDAESALDTRFTAGYRNVVLQWQKRAEAAIKRNVGYIDGTIWHHWHGSYVSRRYDTRAQILVRNQFDPHTDLKKDWQGVIALTGNKPRLRDDIRSYFRQRNEDTVTANSGEYRVNGVGAKPLADWSV